MLGVACRRGFEPECVLFDTWYSALDNLKAVRAYGHQRNRIRTRMSWFEAKVSITRDAVRACLANPQLTLKAAA
jgi:hypothetical protein